MDDPDVAGVFFLSKKSTASLGTSWRGEEICEYLIASKTIDLCFAGDPLTDLSSWAIMIIPLIGTCATTPHVRSVCSSLEDLAAMPLDPMRPLKHAGPGANTLPVSSFRIFSDTVSKPRLDLTVHWTRYSIRYHSLSIVRSG